ncbi:hypothetical protein HDV00_000614 [Rhizophlyctis rosea]|nr:hypothetical protein HDV00_000614 [Rhizophlyctis rosea]
MPYHVKFWSRQYSSYLPHPTPASTLTENTPHLAPLNLQDEKGAPSITVEPTRAEDDISAARGKGVILETVRDGTSKFEVAKEAHTKVDSVTYVDGEGDIMKEEGSEGVVQEEQGEAYSEVESITDAEGESDSMKGDGSEGVVQEEQGEAYSKVESVTYVGGESENMKEEGSEAVVQKEQGEIQAAREAAEGKQWETDDAVQDTSTKKELDRIEELIADCKRNIEGVKKELGWEGR